MCALGSYVNQLPPDLQCPPHNIAWLYRLSLSPPNPSSNILRSLAAVVRRSQSNFRFRFEWLRSSHSVARISIRGVTPSLSSPSLSPSLVPSFTSLFICFCLTFVEKEGPTLVGCVVKRVSSDKMPLSNLPLKDVGLEGCVSPSRVLLQVKVANELAR